MPEVEPPVLEIQLLRGPTVTTDHRPVAIPGRLQRRVLWRLAVAGGALVETEDLIADVWPSDRPRTAAGMIGSHIARLRSLLSAHGLPADRLLPRSDGGYRIDGELTRVDVHALTGRAAACRDADADDPVAVERAVADLQRFVPTTEEPGADTEPWLRDAIDVGWLSIREICRLALTSGPATGLDGRRTAIFGAVSALARRWPYDETVAAWQVDLLARSGRPAEALRTMSAVRDRLAEDLGVDPSPELTRAYELALGLSVEPAPGGPSPRSEVAMSGVVVPGVTVPGVMVPGVTVPGVVSPVDPPHTLPHPPAPLVGRDADLTRLRAAIADDRSAGPATVMITGPAGVGKSGVALRLAADLAAGFPHGQLYLDLHARHRRGVGDPDDDADSELAGATAAALTLLGVPSTEQPRRTADRTAVLRSLTATVPMLWVFDNVRPQHALAPLLPTAPGSLAIVTAVTAHPDLPPSPRHELGRLTDADADRLLGELVGPGRLDGDRSGRRRIVELCEGLPAAVRGTAGRVRELDHLPLSVLADRLDDEGHRLEQFSLGSHGVAAALELSRDGLPETARTVLPGLGLLPDGVIDPDRVAAVVDLPVPITLAALDDLVRAGLLGWDDSGPAPGHRISGLISHWALRLWHAEHTGDETAAAQARADGPIRPSRPRLVAGEG